MPGPTDAPPVVFIHGLWLHASSWQPWTKLFEDTGYTAIAPGWPGDPDTVEEARANPDRLADHGIDEVVDSGWREVADAALTWLHKQGP